VEPLAVDIKEAARLTSLSVRTIRRYIKDSRIRAVRVGHRVIVPLDSLRDLVSPGSGPGVPEKTSAPDGSPIGGHPTRTLKSSEVSHGGE
jgi:excisionase family DNA binding protein